MSRNSTTVSKKNEKTILKATCSVLFAIIASAHHWLHTLLIALGLTTLGAGLLSLPPALRAVFLLLSLAFSVWFIIVARRKWVSDRPAALVYLISSLISIVLVTTAIPQTISSLNQPAQQLQQQNEHNHHSQ